MKKKKKQKKKTAEKIQAKNRKNLKVVDKKLASAGSAFVIDKIGRVSSESVLKCTGKSWDEWVGILQKAGADRWSHKEIVVFLVKKYRLSLWWRQGVATGYETHLGKKIEGRNSKGEYSVVTSKTLPVSQAALWDYMVSPAGLAVWLKPLDSFTVEPGAQFECEGEVFGEIRTMMEPLRLRLKWRDLEWEKASILMLYLLPRPKEKSVLVFQHDGLKDGRLKIQFKEHWKQILSDVEQSLKADLN